MKSSNEMFNKVFEEIIVPVINRMTEADYKKMLEGKSTLCINEADFKNFYGAFLQRTKLFYFRQFTKYKKEGREKFFPESIERVERDVHFLYVEFKLFLKEQRLKMKSGE